MMMGDKKKIAAIILAGVKPKTDFEKMKDKNSDSFDEIASAKGEKKDVSEGLLSASEEIIGAMQSKDPKALASALKDFVVIMQDGDDDEEDESDEPAGE